MVPLNLQLLNLLSSSQCVKVRNDTRVSPSVTQRRPGPPSAAQRRPALPWVAQGRRALPSFTQRRPPSPIAAQRRPASPRVTQGCPGSPNVAQRHSASPRVTQGRLGSPSVAQHSPAVTWTPAAMWRPVENKHCLNFNSVLEVHHPRQARLTICGPRRTHTRARTHWLPGSADQTGR